MVRSPCSFAPRERFDQIRRATAHARREEHVTRPREVLQLADKNVLVAVVVGERGDPRHVVIQRENAEAWNFGKYIYDIALPYWQGQLGQNVVGKLVFDAVHNKKGGGDRLQHHDRCRNRHPPIRELSRGAGVA